MSNVVSGHGEHQGIWELCSYKFFQSREAAKKYVEEDSKKPLAGQVIKGQWVEGTRYLSHATIMEFKLED